MSKTFKICFILITFPILNISASFILSGTASLLLRIPETELSISDSGQPGQLSGSFHRTFDYSAIVRSRCKWYLQLPRQVGNNIPLS